MAKIRCASLSILLGIAWTSTSSTTGCSKPSPAGSDSGAVPGANATSKSPAGSGPGAGGSPVVPAPQPGDLATAARCLAELVPCAETVEKGQHVGVVCASDIARCGRLALGEPEAPPGSSPASAGEEQGPEVPLPVSSLPCLPGDAPGLMSKTINTLLALERAMEGFELPTTAEPGLSSGLCLTKVAARNEPRQAREESRRVADEQQRNAQQAEDAEELRAILLVIAWTWDPGWNAREATKVTYGCRSDILQMWLDRVTGRGECAEDGGTWQFRSRQVIPGSNAYAVDGVAVQPELTKRTEQSGDTSRAAADQYCVVQEAEILEGLGVLTCSGFELTAPYRVLLPADAVAQGGAVGHVRIGDLVRIHGHQIVRGRFGEAASSTGRTRGVAWEFDAVPPDGASILYSSTCCAAAASSPAAPADAEAHQ